MKFFYDTETDGLGDEHKPFDHPSQPHLVQLGCLLTNDEGLVVASADLIVKPDGYVIPDGAARVHGITTAIATELGVPLLLACQVFTHLRSKAEEMIAHNFAFDERVMNANLFRTGKTSTLPVPPNRTCTKDLLTDVIQLPPTKKMLAAGFNKFKPPTLMEAYKYMFNDEFKGAHSALADCYACHAVYFEHQRRLRVGQEQGVAS